MVYIQQLTVGNHSRTGHSPRIFLHVPFKPIVFFHSTKSIYKVLNFCKTWAPTATTTLLCIYIFFNYLNCFLSSLWLPTILQHRLDCTWYYTTHSNKNQTKNTTTKNVLRQLLHLGISLPRHKLASVTVKIKSPSTNK